MTSTDADPGLHRLADEDQAAERFEDAAELELRRGGTTDE